MHERGREGGTRRLRGTERLRQLGYKVSIVLSRPDARLTQKSTVYICLENSFSESVIANRSLRTLRFDPR